MDKLYWCWFLIFTANSVLTELNPVTKFTFNINGEDFQIPYFVGSGGADPQAPADAATSGKVGFSEPLYIVTVEKEKLKSGYKLPVDIKLTGEITPKSSFEIVDGQKAGLESYFEASAERETVTFGVKTDIPAENLKNVNPIVLLLKLIPEGGEKGDSISYTVIVIYLQDKPPETQKITFEKSKYEITAFTEYTGMIEQFVAKLEYNGGKSSLTYDLLATDETLKSSLKINPQTGVLDIVKPLVPGVYTFKISAKIDDKVHAESDVVMTVSHVAVCDSSNVKFQWSQLIRHITEGKTGEVVPGFKTVDKCVYKVLWQKPEGDYFEVNPTNGALTLKKEVKRDSDIFKDTKHPKFVIKMSVKCDTAAAGDDEAAKKDENQPSAADHYFDIVYNPNDLIVIVLIDPANPASIFKADKIFIGYPKDYGIITNYGISRVTSVSAVLRDGESNVEYSIVGDDCPFSVDPRTGNVYPLSYYGKDEDYAFTVSAKDAKKEEKLSVTVKMLTGSQIVEIFFIDVTPENIDKLLQDFSANIGVEMRTLAYAVVPITDEERASNKGLEKKQTHLLRALCYAINEKEHSVVGGGEIAEKLKTSSNIYSIKVLKNKDESDSKSRSGSDDESSSFVLKMAIISVILALTVIISVLFLIIRRRKAVPVLRLRGNNARNSVTPLEDDMEAPSRTRWVDSHPNFYKKYDHTNDSSFPNAAFQSRTLYSHSNDEIIMMENRRATTSNELLPSGVSSFKPDTISEDPSAESIITKTVYRDLEFPFNGDAGSSNASNNVPVLEVTSLPPISSERRRKPDGEDVMT